MVTESFKWKTPAGWAMTTSIYTNVTQALKMS
jgi:hypothetical protein